MGALSRGERFRYETLEGFLRTRVDPVAIDETGEYPEEVIQGLRDIGAFGMVIPDAYGGLGLSHREYERVMMLVGGYDANVAALLSAHQSIGVPQPLILFGSEDQKRKYLPRCARGAISAFALTEPTVGSDPARIASTAEPTSDGRFFVLNGTKLWCTNGTLAELLVVMARTPGKNQISAFIVEADWEGVEVVHRCRFMGLKALANAQLAFRRVMIPRENLIGEEGRGLKIALATLNTGRLSLPASSAGGAKAALEASRKWALARVQWGQPIGRHEAVAHMLADMAGATFAMEALADVTSAVADREGYDIRLEAAGAKEWSTVEGWRICDAALEIRGGRGFESERSLAARGEVAVGTERMMRDSRANRIFEGSSEIMHLFMAREAVDKHLDIAGPLVDPRATFGNKCRALVRALGFYAVWYPSRWLGWPLWPRYRSFGRLARHVRFIERCSRKLARTIFYAMLRYGGALERKQAFLARAVDIATELFAMAAVASRNQRLSSERSLTAPGAARLADQFCRDRRRKIGALFWSLWRNDDDLKRRVGREIAEGHASWLEAGILGLGVTVDALRPAGAAAAEPPAVDAPPPETVLPDDAVHAHSPAGSSR
jgi:alkylation response protein AidB-like acyl-CoA dehydrogenase